MRQGLWILLATLLLWYTACSSERQQKQEIIKGLEQAVQQNPSDEFLRPLVANYLEYANAYKEDEKTPTYLYRAAVLYYRVGNTGEASVHLERILLKYPQTPILEDAYLLLGTIQTGPTGQRQRAEEIYREYLEKFPNGKGVAEAEYFFLPAEEKLQDLITEQLTAIAKLPRGQEPSKAQLLQLIYSYASFVKAKPEAPLAATYALEGARLAISLEEHLTAVQFLEKIYHDYPDFDRYPEALLLLAVEYDTNLPLYIRQGKIVGSPLDEHIKSEDLNDLNPIAQGKKLYQEIIKRYPDSEVAASARSGLKNLGKKTEEVIEEFLMMQDSINEAQKLSPSK